MSILRSSKFFRYFISFARNIVISAPREIDGSLIQRSLNLASPSSRFFCQALPKERNIEKFIQKLDQDVRRTGRISRRELEEAFNEMKNLKQASSTQSLLIIRCCGNLVPEESQEVRTKLVKEIWSTFERIGVPLDISHYNALLRVYLENEYLFSPTEFLAALQSKGVEPNRVTYQRLIAAYCQRGDIEGATQILEFMKQKMIPVNESVFSSLINGHFQAGDIQSAIGILGLMKQANIIPSAETYTVLMCGYAKNGDMNAINEVLALCESQNINISDKDLLEVMYTLAVNNHVDLIDQLVGRVRNLPGYNQDAKNAILRLIVRGIDFGALKILRTMKPAASVSGDIIPAGNFLIKHMVKCNRPVENIVNVCKQLKESGENESALFIATEAALVNGYPELSLKLLTILSKDHEVCQHYYWPVLVHYGKDKNIQGTAATLQQMVEEVKQPVSGETLRDYVAPYVPEGSEGVFAIRQAGVPLATAAAAMVGHLLLKNNIKLASETALQFRAKYNSLQLGKNVAAAFVNTKDMESFISLVRIVADNEKEDDGGDASDRILLEVIDLLGRAGTADIVESILEGYLNAGIGISCDTAEALQNMLTEKQLSSEISVLLSKLTAPGLIPSSLMRPDMPRRAVERDEASIVRSLNIATSKGENASGLKKQLLNIYFSNKDIEKAELLIRELKADPEFEFTTGTLISIMDLYIQHDRLTEALDYYKEITISDPNVIIDPSKILKLGTLMLKNNMIEETIELLQKHDVQPDSTSKGFSTNSAGWRLLNALAEMKDAENLKRIFNILVDKKYIEVSNIMLGPLIKVHILRDDIYSALNEFEECCRKYRATPWKNEIACKLIQKEDPVALQKLTDLSTEIHGEINSLYDLVLSFIECGRVRQARKILETPGLRSRTQRINSACERYNNEGMVNHLENLVEATRDLHHIDRSEIYYHLLLSYCKNDDVEKALGLWTQMQDEDVQPAEQFFIKLGSLLKKHNKPVPFALPKAANAETVESKQTAQQHTPSHIKSFRRAINAKDIDEAQSIMSRIDGTEFSNTDRSRLINLLLANGRMGEASKLVISWLEKGVKPQVKTLSFLINNLAKAGDVDTMANLGRVLHKDLKKMTSFSNRLTHCMVEAGRANDVLAKLEADIKLASTEEEIQNVREEFPRGGIYSVIDKSPDVLTRLEGIAKTYREKGILEPSNILWTHYYIIGNKEKATEMWSYLDHKGRLLLLPVLKHIRASKDTEMANNLLDLFKTSGVQPLTMGLVYSLLIDIANSLGNTKESENILEEALKTCKIEDINRNVLMRLKKSSEIEGNTFKYPIPPKRNRRGNDSSSSDSDSDTEPSQARSR